MIEYLSIKDASEMTGVNRTTICTVSEQITRLSLSLMSLFDTGESTPTVGLSRPSTATMNSTRRRRTDYNGNQFR